MRSILPRIQRSLTHTPTLRNNVPIHSADVIAEPLPPWIRSQPRVCPSTAANDHPVRHHHFLRVALVPERRRSAFGGVHARPGQLASRWASSKMRPSDSSKPAGSEAFWAALGLERAVEAAGGAPPHVARTGAARRGPSP